MELFSRIVILAICFLTAHSWPSGFNVFHGQQDNCTAEFLEQQQNINSQVSNQTAKCMAATEAAKNETLRNLAPQTNEARRNLTALESNLNKCSSISDDLIFVSCISDDYAKNYKLLTNSFTSASNVEDTAIQVFEGEDEKEGICVQNVLNSASKNFTEAYENYKKCIGII